MFGKKSLPGWPSEIQSLAARTEGWVTGLRLASLALQTTAATEILAAQDRRAFIDAFTASDRFLTDYLLDEVF